MLLSRLLRPLIRIGRLTVIDADGQSHVFGTDSEPSVTVRLHDRSLHWRLALNPGLHAGEAYMAGTLTVEDATSYEFIELFARNLECAGAVDLGGPVDILNRSLRRLKQFNPAPRARRNVAHHYDLSAELYDLFLDADRQYSCAYFTEPGQDLETAQLRKKQHIAAKLHLEPGMRVLDIGCGWGGLGLYLAERLGAEVTGITLSTEQLALANARAAAAGLEASAQFHLRDYRHETGNFDRIVSVGMFEHVGVNHYGEFFRTVHDRLADDGVALLHTIGRRDGPGSTNPWLQKYIFPGGYSPSLSELSAAIERSGLWINDVEVLRLHYAETLRHWRLRFEANRAQVAALYDERFCRMWEFYLATSEVSFRHLDSVVFQLQLSKRRDAVPQTRNYQLDTERRLVEAERDDARPRLVG
ncbi:MAG: cyclopropane-fatty-acyl-phospholipid synthase family protein [Geminicoccaceae bacterium]